MTAEDKKLDKKQARLSAMNMLARREQSRMELSQKLAQRGFAYDDIEACLDRLEHQGLQSDQRFTSSFISYRQRRGYGPIRIKQELQKKGIASQLQYDLLMQQQIDWFESASQVISKRFDAIPSGLDFKLQQQLKAKQYRYLQYRGFEQEQIQYAMTYLTEQSELSVS